MTTLPSPRTHGIHNKVQLMKLWSVPLKQAAIWDEVKDRLNKSILVCLVVNSNGFALLELWPLNLKFSSWMNQQVQQIRFQLVRDEFG